MDKYMNEDNNKPKYLFHGSPILLDTLEPHMAHDSSGNKENIGNAVFLTPFIEMASAYAFKDKIKELSKDLDYDFVIGYNPGIGPNIEMHNIIADDDLEGYIYVVPFDDSFEHHGQSSQYKAHTKLKPIDVFKIRFGDYKKYYKIINNSMKR